MTRQPECVDCRAEGITSVRPVEGVRVKRCATHRRTKKNASKAKARGSYLLRTYNMTDEEYRKLYAFQGGRCSWCLRANGATRALSVDHDHSCCPAPPTCGQCTRGLLCRPCNDVLGHFRDNVALVERGADYLYDPPMAQLRRAERKDKTA